MKNERNLAYTVRLDLIGLTGPYSTEVKVMAINEQSALNKASKVIGNRDCVGMVVVGIGATHETDERGAQ